MLTVVIAECGLHWFEGTLDHMDARDARTYPEARLYMGEYPFELSPSEFATCCPAMSWGEDPS